MRETNENNDAKQSAITISVLLLVNYCKIQPVDKLVSYDEIKHIILFDPRQTREGRAIMRRAPDDGKHKGKLPLTQLLRNLAGEIGRATADITER